MTSDSDPRDPLYVDEAAVRGELTRVFDVCGSCRACVDKCGHFPRLFQLLDRSDDHDAGLLTPAEQDEVVDACFGCDRCLAGCPYAPGRHELAVDVPALVLRARAMATANRQVSIVDGMVAGRRARSDALRWLAGEPPAGRRATRAWSPTRLLTPSVGERFTTWFDRRPPRHDEPTGGAVVVYPTCLVEYQATEVGRDAVTVFERAGVDCSRSAAGCCGAPWLHSGDRKRFSKLANAVVERLASELEDGSAEAVVVLEPTCRAVMQRDYLDAVRADLRDSAAFVAGRLVAPASHLLAIDSRDGILAGTFPDVRGAPVVVHTACHARGDGSPDAELLRRCGAEVTVVEGCAGIGGRWTFDDDRPDGSTALADDLATRIADRCESRHGPGPVAVVGACSLANRLLAGRLAGEVRDPISVLARSITPE